MTKKRISLLLVLCMLLSLLPVSAADTNAKTGEAATITTDYATISNATVKGNGNSSVALKGAQDENINNSYTFSPDANATITATSENKVTVSFTASPVTGNTVYSVTRDTTTFEKGDNGSYTVNEDITISGSSPVTQNLTYTIKAGPTAEQTVDYTVKLSFSVTLPETEEPTSHNITVEVTPAEGGTASVEVTPKASTGQTSTQAGEQTAKAGDTVKVTATASGGYTFSSITAGDGVNVTTSGTVGTFTMPDRDVTVTVTFVKEADPEKPTPEEVKSIAITPATLGLLVGKTNTLTAEVNHTYKTQPDVVWTSSKPDVATVDAKGTKVTVTAKAVGETTITATCGGVTSNACTVNVSEDAIPATGVTLDQSSLTMNIGEAKELKATVAPDAATNKTVKWESANSAVATVKDGKVAAVSAGTTTITVTTADGSNKSAECTVTVRPEPTITLDKSALTVKMGETATLTATATDGSVENWESSDEGVVKVAGSGNTATITPVAANKSATITVTVTGEGGTKTTTCKVTVTEADAKPAAPTISLSDAELKIIESESASLTATATAYTKIAWKSSDESVASVKPSEDGLTATVTAVKAGKVTITSTATGEGGTANASCTFTVELAKVGDAKIEKTEVAFKTNQTATGAEKTAVQAAEESIKNTDTAIAENLGSVVKATASSGTDSVTVNGETVSTAKLIADIKNMSVYEEGKSEIRTIIVPKIDIQVTKATIERDAIVSLSFKVDAYAEVKVTVAKEGETVDGNNSVTADQTLPLNNTKETITVNLPLPESFTMPKNPSVKHEKDSGGTFWHRAYKAERGNGVWFKNSRGFSTLTVTDTPATMEAEYNGELYTSLSDAIKDAENNATITVLKKIENTVTVSEPKTFTLAYHDGVELGSVKIEAGTNYKLDQKDNTYTVSKESTGSGGGGGGGGGSSKPAIKPGDKPTTPGTTAPSGGVAGFNDVAPGAWYADSVKYVVEKGLFGGVGNGNFAPNANMTRAMMWTVLARYMGVDTNTGSNWYEAARAWAIEKGISDGTMADGNVTREQFVTMLWRLSGKPTVDHAASFTDSGKVSSYAKTAVDWAVAQGIVNGYNDGTFKPQGSATRAEVAKMLTIFCQ